MTCTCEHMQYITLCDLSSTPYILDLYQTFQMVWGRHLSCSNAIIICIDRYPYQVMSHSGVLAM